jgi:hypothetical protein
LDFADGDELASAGRNFADFGDRMRSHNDQEVPAVRVVGAVSL